MGARTDRQRGRILAAIADKAMTAQELADSLYMSRDNVSTYLVALKAEKRIHVDSYLCNPKGGRPAPRMKAGKLPDAVYVKTRAPKGNVPAMRREQIKKALRNRMLSVLELAERLDLHPAYVRRKVRELRDAKQVRIAGFGQATEGGFLPLYGLGSEPDAVIQPADPLKRHKAYRERHKDRLNAKRRMRDRLRKRPNTWASALGL